MAVVALRRLAASASIPFYAAVGRRALRDIEDIALSNGLSAAASVRHAGLLFVSGALRRCDLSDLRRLHDQLPHPRATVWWRTEPDPAFGPPLLVDADDDPAPVLEQTGRQLFSGERGTEPDILPDEPPAPWRGRGDHGQGGEGMMGGKPYGRPMAMTGDDLRDGLALDVTTIPVGPFFAALPPGLKLEIALQGDVIQEAKVLRRPLPQDDGPSAGEPLRLIARQLRVLGLAALAQRFLGAAREADRGRPADLRPLARLLAWSGARHAIPRKLGGTADGDVRSRFEDWWRAAMTGAAVEPSGSDGPPLTELMRGLEWNEAVLVANSFDSVTLARLCPDDDDGEQPG